MECKNRIIVNFLGKTGGGPAYAYAMTRGLIENGYSVIAFVSAETENIALWKQLCLEELVVVKTFRSIYDLVPATIRFLLSDFPTLKKKYNSLKNCTMYIPMGHVWSKFICDIFPDAPIIYTLHDPKPHSTNRWVFDNIADYFSRMPLEVARDVVILSDVFREYVKEKLGIDNSHIHTVPHGYFDVYEDVWNGDIYPYSSNKWNFLFFGRICKYKGIGILAKAFSKVQESRKDCTLTIVGSGDFSLYEDNYRGIENVTVVNKWIDDSEVASYFVKNRNVVLVLPYCDATQSGVAPLAMASRVLVIASDIGGLREQLRNGEVGVLFDANNPDSLSNAMLQVMERDNIQMINRAEKYIRSLSWRNLSGKIGNICGKGIE